MNIELIIFLKSNQRKKKTKVNLIDFESKETFMQK